MLYCALYFRNSRDQRREALARGLGRRAFDVLGVQQVTPKDRACIERITAVGGEERVQRLLQPRAVLADGRRDITTAPQCHRRKQFQFRKDALPEPRLVIVDDEQIDQSGVGHLEQVLIFHFFGRRRDTDRRFSFARQLRVATRSVHATHHSPERNSVAENLATESGDRNLRAGDAPVFESLTGQNLGRKRGVRTVRNLDLLSGVFSTI